MNVLSEVEEAITAYLHAYVCVYVWPKYDEWYSLNLQCSPKAHVLKALSPVCGATWEVVEL
jgi:hypothetical protein